MSHFRKLKKTIQKKIDLYNYYVENLDKDPSFRYQADIVASDLMNRHGVMVNDWLDFFNIEIKCS